MQQKDKAMETAIRALAGREHSEKEIVEKLTRKGFDEKTIAQVMAKLSEHGLTDDAAFAEKWAKHRANRGMGPYRIAFELRQKGLGSEGIDEALAGIDEAASFEAAVALAQKALRRGDERARKRAYDMLIRRGFSYSLAKSAVEAAESEEYSRG